MPSNSCHTKNRPLSALKFHFPAGELAWHIHFQNFTPTWYSQFEDLISVAKLILKGNILERIAF